MGRSAKKIDGRSKQARAARAATFRTAKHPWGESRATTAPKKPVKKQIRAKPAEVTLDTQTSLRILALQIASNNINRDTAPRDLVPMARQIEEFLNGATHNVAVGAIGGGYQDIPVTNLECEAYTHEALVNVEHAFD
jgi:hypothetical protein